MESFRLRSIAEVRSQIAEVKPLDSDITDGIKGS